MGCLSPLYLELVDEDRDGIQLIVGVGRFSHGESRCGSASLGDTAGLRRGGKKVAGRCGRRKAGDGERRKTTTRVCVWVMQ